MNELWHTLASIGATISAGLVSVLYHLYAHRLERMEKSQEKFAEETDDSIAAIRERLACLEERSRHPWNGIERRGESRD
jgi:hypothetical protein